MGKRHTSSACGRTAESVTEEELQAFLLKLTRQIRDQPSPGHVVKNMNGIEAQVERIIERRPHAQAKPETHLN